MNDTSANPIFVALLFILRCIVPLAILFGISYLLRKMGLVAVESPEPPDENSGEAAETTPQIETVTAESGGSKAGPDEMKTIEHNKES
ncbi:hypothetical protein ANAEL_05312 [Anaerolineales bacterium]|nr:hypothetical protein ANAEL_05312 [Anaerolineales bacterium]